VSKELPIPDKLAAIFAALRDRLKVDIKVHTADTA
jgi:hypothetical protein